MIAEYSRPFGPFQTLDTDTQDLILDRAAAQVGIELLQAEAAARKPIDHGEMAKYLNAKNRARRGLNKRLPKPAEPKDALAEHLARTYGSAAE